MRKRTRPAQGRVDRRVVGALLTLLRPRRWIVVHGWRDGEENALRIAGALSVVAPDDVRITLLGEDTQELQRQLHAALASTRWRPHRIDLRRKNSLAGVLRFARASLVLTTHGMFGNPDPGHKRLHVLLGHGHGPKSASSPLHPFLHRAQLATTNNPVWGFAVIRDQAIDVDRNAVATGNPREDAFDESVNRGALRLLGIDPERPFIVWLPTFRVPTNAPMTSTLREASEDALLRARLKRLHSAAAAAGIHDRHEVAST